MKGTHTVDCDFLHHLCISSLQVQQLSYVTISAVYIPLYSFSFIIYDHQGLARSVCAVIVQAGIIDTILGHV